MNLIVINIILIIFPILIYLVFSCYNLLTNEKITKLIFIITMCTSLYLSLNFNQNNNLLLIFCNIPTLICYFKKETRLGILFSLIVVLISYLKYDVNLSIVGLKYLGYFITYILLLKKKPFGKLAQEEIIFYIHKADFKPKV